MLDTLQRLADWMRPAAPVFALTGVALALLCIGLLLFFPDAAGDRVLLPAIAALVWCLCGYVFIQAFAALPPPPDAGLRGWQRVKRRFSRAWHWLLAFVFLGTTVAAGSVTSRIIGEALG